MIIVNDCGNNYFEKEYTITITLTLIKILLITAIYLTNTRTNYLILKSKDYIYINSTLYGVILNFIANLFLISKFKVYGACIDSIITEIFIMLYQMSYSYKK